jgi:DNA processing protein
MNDSRLYWIGFNLVKGIGAVRFRQLLAFFGSAAMAWQAPSDALEQAGLSPKIIHNLVQIRKQVDLEQVWARIQQLGILVLTWEDEAYPRLLKEIEQPPPVLYSRGSLLIEDEWAVAVVGTRRMTSYGRQVVEDIATALAASGVTVVSGLAIGIDTHAHQAALRTGGRTLAVLGSGVDHIYPPSNRRLAEEIIANGALLSDYPPGTGPDAANFPARNRIISGLARIVVVVEAGETSGALITANFALEQGRDVFAVPGSIYAPQSKGTNRLIQQGATPLLDPQELLAVLNMTMAVEHKTARTVLPSDPTEAAILATLNQEPRHIDEVQQTTQLPIAQVSAALTMMELKGLVRQVGGMQYVAIREPRENYEI